MELRKCVCVDVYILQSVGIRYFYSSHDDVVKWKPFLRYWPFVRGIHRWIPLTKPVMRSFDVFWDLPEQTVE